MPRTVGRYDAYSPVRTTKLFTDKGVESGLIGVSILDDKGEEVVVGQVGPNYHLVPNQEVDEYMRSLLSDLGLKFRDERLGKSPGYDGNNNIFFDGSRFRRRYLIGDFEVGKDTLNTAIGLHLNVYNSYDGTKKYGYSLGLTVLACLNTMMVDYILGSESFRHLGVKETFMTNRNILENSVTNAVELAKEQISVKLVKLMESDTTVTFMRDILAETEMSNDLFTGMFREARGNTRWDLLNGATAHLSKKNTLSADNTNRTIMRAFLGER